MKNEVVVASFEMLSGLSTKEYAQAAQAVAEVLGGAPGANGAADESDLQAVVAMSVGRRGFSPGAVARSAEAKLARGGGTRKRSAALIVRSRGGRGTDDAQGRRL